MKKIFFILFVTALLFAKDSDLDGVPDEIDRCPNTPFLTIVNKYGCPVKSLKKEKYLKIYIGTEKDFIEDKIYSSLFFSPVFYYKNYFAGSFLSKIKYEKGYAFNTKNIFAGIKTDKLKMKLKYYFKTRFGRKYFSFYLKLYTDFASISFEHKFKDTSYNNLITVSKDFKINRHIKIKPYNLYYINNHKNFTGIYTTYKINKKLSFFTNISTGTNNHIKDYYFSIGTIWKTQ